MYSKQDLCRISNISWFTDPIYFISYNPECIYQMPGASFADLKIIHDFNKIIMENAKADYGTSVACICQIVSFTLTHRHIFWI